VLPCDLGGRSQQTGTRIEFYAVDIPPSQQFVDTSLADALRFAAQRGSHRFPLWFHTDSGRYLASPEYGILFDDQQGRGKGYAHPTEAELDADPHLAISCQHHLALGDTGQLGGLLRVLADSDATPWLRELSRGYRYWWICSLLDALQHSDVLAIGDRERYEGLLRRVLRSVRCGPSLPERKVARKQSDFAVVPQWEDEHWEMGIWTSEDVELFLQCTDGLLASGLEFGKPADLELLHITDWNEWVPEMLRQLHVIGQLGYTRPNMVSFIG
jgi:hypothetical protein